MVASRRTGEASAVRGRGRRTAGRGPGAYRRRLPARTRRYATVALLGGFLLLAGCASMPDSGGVHQVPLSEQREDPRARTYAERPEPGASPQRIVSDFLEALRSDDYATVAKAYLTKKARSWTPGETTVLAEAPTVSEQPMAGPKPVNGDKMTTAVVQLSGDKVAWLNDAGTYTPDERVYNLNIELSKEGKSGQWRIVDPPRGLVISRADFERTFQSASTYHFTARSRDTLVADPVYVRRRIDPVTDAVRTLLDGPGGLIGTVTETTFPERTALAKNQRLTVDEEGTLRVRLALETKPGLHTCERMAAQVLHTAESQEGVRVDNVELLTARDTKLCDLSATAGERYAPDRLARHPSSLYFIDAKNRLVRTSSGPDAGEAGPATVISPLGDGKPAIGSAAVARSEKKAAGVTATGRALYVSSLDESSALGEPLLTSGATEAQAARGDGLTAASWDGLGDLWVADRVGGESRLYWMAGGTADPVRIDVTGLEGRIEALRMSAEGARIALVVSEGSESRLVLGAVSVKDGVPVVAQLRDTGALEEVRAVSWAGESRLLVVGRESEGVQQMRLVSTDGSVPPAAELGQGLTGVTAVAAAEDGTKPLVAASEDGIVRLPQNAYWKAVPGGEGGTAPVYPG
ncbi:LpqB family beta-propeller domain-containing protein [Streptomyces sp. NBC_01808]|uniref:LpqB family beta-propeller domain-containing protein n=1 Tax=Streptomyces sp. NBC_01808 TaxID=2975947 RepID=UPI002DD8A14A|nr:LpqB family beta-propeller domain-containing protein [Streptomyces sp. NBC_01808]WSA38135.1 LpqB family beta-propeller domain-containing protein [Streptomyces sp. NBC_01808]